MRALPVNSGREVALFGVGSDTGNLPEPSLCVTDPLGDPCPGLFYPGVAAATACSVKATTMTWSFRAACLRCLLYE